MRTILIARPSTSEFKRSHALTLTLAVSRQSCSPVKLNVSQKAPTCIFWCAIWRAVFAASTSGMQLSAPFREISTAVGSPYLMKGRRSYASLILRLHNIHTQVIWQEHVIRVRQLSLSSGRSPEHPRRIVCLGAFNDNEKEGDILTKEVLVHKIGRARSAIKASLA